MVMHFLNNLLWPIQLNSTNLILPITICCGGYGRLHKITRDMRGTNGGLIKWSNTHNIPLDCVQGLFIANDQSILAVRAFHILHSNASTNNILPMPSTRATHVNITIDININTHIRIRIHIHIHACMFWKTGMIEACPIFMQKDVFFACIYILP